MNNLPFSPLTAIPLIYQQKVNKAICLLSADLTSFGLGEPVVNVVFGFWLSTAPLCHLCGLKSLTSKINTFTSKTNNLPNLNEATFYLTLKYFSLLSYPSCLETQSVHWYFGYGGGSSQQFTGSNHGSNIQVVTKKGLQVRSHLYYLIYLGHLIRSREVTIGFFFLSQDL